MKRNEGFTLVEILIVVIIVAILAGLTVAGVMSAFESSRISSTEAMIQQVKAVLESYQSIYHDYPPTSLAAFKVKVNKTNNGIESLTACLSSRRNGGPHYRPPSEELYSNTDADSVKTNVTDWYFGDSALREITDYFGHPLIYFHHRDYAKPSSSDTMYLIGDKEEPCQPSRSALTKAFHNPDTYQIWSVGPNGINENGGGDDIVGW